SLSDDLNPRSKRFVRIMSQHDQLAGSADDHEQIIEIVCHSSSEPSERFHLLSLLQLQFQLTAFGDVFQHDLLRGNLALIGIKCPRGDDDGACLAIASAQIALELYKAGMQRVE